MCELDSPVLLSTFLGHGVPSGVIKCQEAETEGPRLLYWWGTTKNINALMKHLMVKSPPILLTAIFPIDPENSYEDNKSGHYPILQMKSSDWILLLRYLPRVEGSRIPFPQWLCKMQEEMDSDFYHLVKFLQLKSFVFKETAWTISPQFSQRVSKHSKI